MKSAKSQTVTSLLTALFFVVAFVLTGCGTDTLTGPDFGSETTVQSDGGDGGGAHHNNGSNGGGG